MNGPALAARGKTVWAVWYTEGDEETPRVCAARSKDRGKSFDAPVTISEGSPLGRVDVVVLADGSSLVSFLEDGGEGKQASLRVRRILADGALTPPVEVAKVPPRRSSGFPRMTASREGALIAWTERGDKTRRVRLARLLPTKN